LEGNLASGLLTLGNTTKVVRTTLTSDPEKLAEIQTQLRGTNFDNEARSDLDQACLDFWSGKNAAYDKHTVVLWGRDNQIRLFHVLRTMLNDQGKRLVHIGMRSGGLDMFAISGQRTIYVIGPDTKDERIPLLAEAI
jgi:hypothetical protein